MPTFFLVIVLHWFLKKVLFEPLDRVMEERRRRTDGVLESCEAAMERAQARLREYENALRQAQAEIFDQQEAERKQMAARQAALLDEARQRARERVEAARAEIAAETVQAREALRAQAAALADSIARMVLAGRTQ
ncbi:MAG: ATP synthase F0 subunit B [Bryobacteraceae bacterium]|nr:ATP synthase F0 subunit B [Bryobacteraceae bacterium]